MKSAAHVVNRLLKARGTYEGLPRIYNADLDTYTVGFTEVNTQATTAFARTKMHKAWLVGTSDIIDGSRIVDRVDGHRYIVMSLKKEYTAGNTAFVDGTLMYVTTTCTISRMSSSVDAFGRKLDADFTDVATGIWLMLNPMAEAPLDLPERQSDKSKIKVAMQSSVDVKINDRISTEDGEVYKVDYINRAELDNVVMLYVIPDNR
jgi:hypothetical protein